MSKIRYTLFTWLHFISIHFDDHRSSDTSSCIIFQRKTNFSFVFFFFIHMLEFWSIKMRGFQQIFALQFHPILSMCQQILSFISSIHTANSKTKLTFNHIHTISGVSFTKISTRSQMGLLLRIGEPMIFSSWMPFDSLCVR